MDSSVLPVPEYCADNAVDAALDLALRDLLAACFTGPNDRVFTQRRYFHEPPAHRWILRAGASLIAHVAVHEKIVTCGGAVQRIGGVAEVCVRPGFRGRGYVRHLLSAAHPWLAARGFAYAVLFGRTAVYLSSGYAPVTNLHPFDFSSGPTAAKPGAMVRSLGPAAWPQEVVFLHGPRF